MHSASGNETFVTSADAAQDPDVDRAPDVCGERELDGTVLDPRGVTPFGGSTARGLRV